VLQTFVLRGVLVGEKHIMNFYAFIWRKAVFFNVNWNGLKANRVDANVFI
jgi:hypothetical protein